MLHLANLCLFVFLFANLLGLALATGLWLRNAWLALTAGPWIFCGICFFLEGFHGFGSLAWLSPITTAISALLLLEVTGKTHFLASYDQRLKLEEWKRELSPFLNPLPYTVFALLFCYTMVWRYTFPDIDGSSEKLADLSFICSYLTGETIPVHDIWFYPFISTHYYSFQYYAAALMGRILDLNPGTTYNVAFCTLISLAGTAGIGAVCLATRKVWIRLLVSLGWILGGSGVTIINHITTKDPGLWENIRFIGSGVMDRAPLGTFLDHYTKYYTPKELHTAIDLPGEPLSYSIYLGDYHPPLAGFYLLALALLSLNIWMLLKLPRALVIVGGCLPLCLISDTWNVPLEAVGLIAWATYNRSALRTVGWRYLVGGIVAGIIIIYPYFKYFAFASSDYPTVLRIVPWRSHTPPLLWLLFLLPTFGLVVMAIFSRNKPTIALGRLWLCFLIFSEFVFVNDIYSGEFLRFNTTLKWWPWIGAATLLTLGPRLLELRTRRWVWYISLFLVSYPIFYAWDLYSNWSGNTNKVNFGHLDGTAFLDLNNNDDHKKDHLMLDFLQSAPKGIVVEDPELDFTNTSAMTLLSGQRALLGWKDHENLWRSYPYEIQYRFEQLQKFYKGDMPNAGSWMQTQGVDYILWFKTALDLDPAWDKVDASLHPQYVWHEFYYDRGHRVGIWERNKAPSSN